MRHRLAAACLVSAAVVALSRASCRQRAARAVATAAVANLSANQTAGAIEAASRSSAEPAPPPPPPLSDLVDAAAQRVKSPSGVGFLLDFAIVGYPKTGTSFLLDWLARASDQVLARTSEVHDLADGRVADFVAGLYRLRPGAGNNNSSSGGGAASSPFPGSGYKRGYKAPRDLQIPEAMAALDLYWPGAALIVGLRHPVLWFESYYNFRVRKGAPMPPADSSLFLAPGCASSGRARGVCAEGCRYHAHLSRLGKTPMTSPEELGLLGADGGTGPEAGAGTRRRPNRRRIFLYEISQLREASGPGAAAVVDGTDNSTRSSLDGGAVKAVAARAERFRLDLSRFLGLDRPLADDYSEPSQYLPNRTRALDICEPRYSELRRHLMRNAREASTWIREYLLAPRPSFSASSEAGDVVVSSPSHFRSLLRAWMSDPCLEGR
jgi:hypothetical protein